MNLYDYAKESCKQTCDDPTDIQLRKIHIRKLREVTRKLLQLDELTNPYIIRILDIDKNLVNVDGITFVVQPEMTSDNEGKYHDPFLALSQTCTSCGQPRESARFRSLKEFGTIINTPSESIIAPCLKCKHTPFPYQHAQVSPDEIKPEEQKPISRSNTGIQITIEPAIPAPPTSPLIPLPADRPQFYSCDTNEAKLLDAVNCIIQQTILDMKGKGLL